MGKHEWLCRLWTHRWKMETQRDGIPYYACARCGVSRIDHVARKQGRNFGMQGVEGRVFEAGSRPTGEQRKREH